MDGEGGGLGRRGVCAAARGHAVERPLRLRLTQQCGRAGAATWRGKAPRGRLEWRPGRVEPWHNRMSLLQQ